eukprot:NODE_718_length_1397_cov_89.218101_g529_i0.p1 GENE.NODE_718_length_1397_cov_89.218101_g529_i0~~NODE_718_length_1397_cov_89.218101_g529_i0.p1  ORF type:complete len:220 (-),score=52.60 NODE_718_length_1397_cov_89.218101_g529_i0:374-1033(-)
MDLGVLMKEVARLAADVRTGLNGMESQNNAVDPTARPAEARIRDNQHMMLTRMLMTAMKDYYDTSADYSQQYREQVKRRIQMKSSAGGGEQLTDEQVEEIAQQLLNEGKEQAIFEQLSYTLDSIQEQHRDIILLEQNILELHQICVDFAVLVEEQGEMLDDIVTSVRKSKAYVEKGGKRTGKAVEQQTSTRWKMVCFIFILLLVLGGVVVVMKVTGSFD